MDIYLGIIEMRGGKMLQELQEKINQTEYWDLKILDLQIKYFGDEVIIYVYNDDDTSWKISFSSCYKVNYETDATWRTITHVCDMKRPQLGYYGQDITLNESKEFDGFYDVTIDLTILTAKIVCREIYVEKIANSLFDFFWQEKNN